MLVARERDAVGELGYRYLGDRGDLPNNSNIEEALLKQYLTGAGYTPGQISRAIYLLRTEADNPNRSLYDNNRAVYNLLRYGVQVKIEAGKVTDTVNVIDWKRPAKNDFAIAEEVTLRGNLERRPDLVLYVNGIAVAVIELKNSHTSIGDGIRQLLSNQQKEFNEWFFTTVQIVFAGNDSEGLRYGSIETGEKYFLKWKEDEADNSRFKLDKYLLKMCRKDRLIELMHDFVLFDGGVKKLPRVHQYCAVKASQQRVRAYQGGIIWNTQGSGKSIVMVLLAKWILENMAKARVLILTDRDELDKQIAGVLHDAGLVKDPKECRAKSGQDLMQKLGQHTPRLLCSLVHKFGKKDVDDSDAFLAELKKQPSQAVGELFVFVDECHRTQSGKLHKAMKAMLPGAVFIGFTGTPLLKEDKATSLEVFGGYIHTYKFNEGVADGVVLDLVYEARDIEQSLGSQNKIDAWFEAKTKALNDWQKAALREQWGTMQKVLSSPRGHPPGYHRADRESAARASLGAASTRKISGNGAPARQISHTHQTIGPRYQLPTRGWLGPVESIMSNPHGSADLGILRPGGGRNGGETPGRERGCVAAPISRGVPGGWSSPRCGFGASGGVNGAKNGRFEDRYSSGYKKKAAGDRDDRRRRGGESQAVLVYVSGGGSIWSFIRKLLPSMMTVSAPCSTRSRMAEVTPASLLKISGQRLNALLVVMTMAPRS